MPTTKKSTVDTAARDAAYATVAETPVEKAKRESKEADARLQAGRDSDVAKIREEVHAAFIASGGTEEMRNAVMAKCTGDSVYASEVEDAIKTRLSGLAASARATAKKVESTFPTMVKWSIYVFRVMASRTNKPLEASAIKAKIREFMGDNPDQFSRGTFDVLINPAVEAARLIYLDETGTVPTNPCGITRTTLAVRPFYAGRFFDDTESALAKFADRTKSVGKGRNHKTVVDPLRVEELTFELSLDRSVIETREPDGPKVDGKQTYRDVPEGSYVFATQSAIATLSAIVDGAIVGYDATTGKPIRESKGTDSGTGELSTKPVNTASLAELIEAVDSRLAASTDDTGNMSKAGSTVAQNVIEQTLAFHDPKTLAVAADTLTGIIAEHADLITGNKATRAAFAKLGTAITTALAAAEKGDDDADDEDDGTIPDSLVAAGIEPGDDDDDEDVEAIRREIAAAGSVDGD